MRFFKHLLLIVVLFASVQANAQKDIIFSQYQMSPLTLNPALAGAYEGTYRVGAMRRNQWDISDPTFGTNLAFVDAPLIMVGKRNWVGAGVMFYRDKAETEDFSVKIPGSSITQSQISLSAAFHYAMDKKYKNILTFGLKIGGSNMVYSPGPRYTDFGNDPNNPIVAKIDGLIAPKYVDFGAGVMLKSKIDKKSNISAGFSMDHINRPNASFFTGKTAKLNVLTTVHVDYSRDLNKKLSIMPSLLYRQIAGSKDLTAQAQVGYKLDPVRRPDLTLKAGLGYRLANNYNNLELLLGADYKSFRFFFAYDIPKADLNIAVKNSAELGLHYTGKIYKKPVTKGAHFCPKY